MKFNEENEGDFNQALITTYEESKTNIEINTKDGYMPLGHDINITLNSEKEYSNHQSNYI